MPNQDNPIVETAAGRADCPLCSGTSDMRLAASVSRPDNRLCPACGLVFQPRQHSSQKDLASLYAGDGYWNAQTVKLSRFTRISVLDDVRRGRARLRGIEQLSGRRISAHDTVLDIGCGFGGRLWQIRNKRKARVNGLEPSPVCTQATRSLLGLDVRQGMFEETECSQDGGYSLITSLHTLEHVADPVAFLRRAGELLAPDGRLYIEVPNLLTRRPASHSCAFSRKPTSQFYGNNAIAASRAGLAVAASDSGILRFVLKRAEKADTTDRVGDPAHANGITSFLRQYQYVEHRPARKLRTFLTRAGYAFRLACSILLHPVRTMRILQPT